MRDKARRGDRRRLSAFEQCEYITGAFAEMAPETRALFTKMREVLDVPAKRKEPRAQSAPAA